MKFATKNKPNLNNQDIYDGEKHGVSFEWLIDKLDEKKAFLIKKNENVTIETYIFTCVHSEKKKKAKDCVISKVLECPAFNFFIKSVDTYGNCDTENLIDRELYWFDDKKSNIPNENPQWSQIKAELDINDSWVVKREKIFEILENNGWDMSIPEVTEEMKGDKSLILEAIKNDRLRDVGSNIEYANEKLLNDKKFILKALDFSSHILEYTPTQINDDKNIMLKAVEGMGSAVQYASDKLKKNKKIGLKSVQMEGTAIQFLDDKLKMDPDIIIAATKNDHSALAYINKDIYLKKKLFSEIVKSNGLALEFANDELKKNKKIVFEAVKNNISALVYADKSLKKDKKILHLIKKRTKK